MCLQNLFAICIHIRCSMNIEIKKIRMIVLSFLVKRFQAHCCQRRLLKHHSTYSATSFNCSIDSCWFKTKNIFFETKHEKTFHVLDSFLKLNRGVLFWWQTDKQTDRQTDQVDFFFWFWIRPGLRPEQTHGHTHKKKRKKNIFLLPKLFEVITQSSQRKIIDRWIS